jgi:hypothetical protein
MLKVEIHFKGQIPAQWSEWFGGLTVNPSDRGETLLSGLVADSSALYAIISRLRDLGLELASVSSEEVKKYSHEGVYDDKQN